MKTIVSTALTAAVLLLASFSTGCAAKGGVYGQPIAESNVTSIGDILTRPEEFAGKPVRIEGKIIEECPAGGWFMLKDETGIVYVDLHASNFAIPQAVGRRAAAEGMVKKEYYKVSVVGKGVQLK